MFSAKVFAIRPKLPFGNPLILKMIASTWNRNMNVKTAFVILRISFVIEFIHASTIDNPLSFYIFREHFSRI